MPFFTLLSFCFWLIACNLSPAGGTRSTAPKSPDEKSDENALFSYLKTPFIDTAVRRLALLGVARYADASTGLFEKRKGKPPNGGGRVGDWIKDTFGQGEDEIIKLLEKEPAPKTWTIEEIDHAYQDLLKKHPADSALKKAQFTMVKGVSVNYLHEAPLSHDSFVQLASQFNYLEAPGASKTPVSNYLSDPTQGPQGSIEAAAAALHRTAAEEASKLSNALSRVLPPDHDKYYQHGYLEPWKLTEALLEPVYDHIKANLKYLAILPQWVINEASGVRLLQVFSAAPSYQDRASPTLGSFGSKLCSLLVPAQYEAIAKLAVIRSILINGPVVVHLTLVGQGAFHNPPEVMKEAFSGVAEIVKGFPNVRVYVHGFTSNGQATIRNQVDRNLIDLTEMDEATFMATQQ